MSKDIWVSCFQQEIPYEMLDLANHPTPTDLQKRLGKELADVFLKTCTPFEKILFGRDKSLKGPDVKRMWINPSDRVDGKNVCLTEQLSKTDCLQALSHRGILEIGEKVEKIIEKRHRDDVNAAVKDAEDVARFEADLRIKFHVENERKKLNEEWQQRYDELVMNHDEEKRNLIKIFEDGRKVFCEFFAKKCQDEINKHVEEAVTDTKQQMEKECAEKISDELAQQYIMHQESMEVTLKNLEANDRDKMKELCNECLNAMDVQSNLMLCRQIAEIMQVMSVEKQHWQWKMNELKKTYDTTVKALENKLNFLTVESSSPEHQSNSFIVALWKKFFKSLKTIDVNQMNECEKGILNEIYRIQCNLIENYDDNSSGIFLIQNQNDDDDHNGEVERQKSQDENLIDDWIYKMKDGECLNKDSSVDVKWEKQTSSEVISIEDKFMSSIFHQMSTADAPININDSIFSKTASSIITMVKGLEVDDDKLLESKVIEIIQRLFVEQQVMSSAMDVVPLPILETPHIRNSWEIINKRISMSGESVDTRHHILGVVDSLEILSQRTSMNENKILNAHTIDSAEMEKDDENMNENINGKDTILSTKPLYMEVPAYGNCLYQKMTEDEWKQLKELEESLKMKSQRHSSVQFDNSSPDLPQNTVKRSSILKNPSDISSQRHELNPNHNALHPIQQKCQELMSNMKVKSILKLLCSDDTGMTSSSDSQKK